MLSMNRSFCAGVSALAITFLPVATRAHEIVGNRFFPATLGIDDPGVNDELELPTVDAFKTGDVPPVNQRDLSTNFSKRITEDFAIANAVTYTWLSAPGGPNGMGAHGFQNLDTVFKYRVYRNAEHEFVASVGLDVEWGHTGAASVGAEPFSHYTPTVFFGKGFGDLPDSLPWLRPFALTGQIGYSIPGRRSTGTISVDPDSGDLSIDTEIHPDVLRYGATLQYSMPYLKSAVVDLGLPDFINRLIPLVEVSLQTPIAHTLSSGTVTTGNVQPGLVYVGNTFQIAAEALIPINHQSGTGVGFIAQLHLFLDDIDPRGIGRPIFGGPVQPATPFARN
jgi:hypothetical protein